MVKDKSLKNSVYDVVYRIPRGKVATYGQVANTTWQTQSSKLKAQKRISPRRVGRILHNNPDPKNIPCHRVVSIQGKLAKKYAFGGRKEQKEKLVEEGVIFKKNNQVDLGACLWNGR